MKQNSVFFTICYEVQSNLPYADTIGTNHSCPLTGGVRLQEVEKCKTKQKCSILEEKLLGPQFGVHFWEESA